MSIPMNEVAVMRTAAAAVLETLDLGIELRMFGENRSMPSDRLYGDFWLIGGTGFVLDEEAPQPIVRRVGLVQLTVWQPQGLKAPVKKIVATFNRGFAGRAMCDLLGRAYQFRKKGDVTQIARGTHVATIGRIGFSRDEPIYGAGDLNTKW